jgi:pimeloyl-ACP methyl ester carboxylesterase
LTGRALAGFIFLAASAFSADESSHFTTLDGVKIHYESYGSGSEALVFIHGWTCDLTFWRGQAPVYNAHRSLLLDLPGHGESDKPRRPYPTEFFARAVEAVMNDAGVERIVLVGHSLGGGIAYTFVRLFPEKAKAIVFVDSYASRPVYAQTSSQALAHYRQRAHRLSGPSGQKNFLKQVDAMFSDQTPSEMRADIRRKMLATPEHVRVAAVTSPSKLPPADPNESFDIPALAVNARIGPAGTASLRSIFPNLQVEKWDNYGHFLMMEDPDRFNRSLESFLAAHP